MYYFIGIVTFIGLLLPLFLHFKLKYLIRAAEHPGKSEHPLIKGMINKFTACYKVKVGVNNVDNFVDKYVNTYKIGGLYLFTWDRICGQTAWIILYGCLIQMVVEYFYLDKQTISLSTIGIGLIAFGSLMLYNHLFDRMDKLRVFGSEMADYLENSLGVKLEQEYAGVERPRVIGRESALEQTGDRLEQEQSGKGVLAALSDQEMEALLGELAASVSGRNGLGKDQEIIDEILKEYLS